MLLMIGSIRIKYSHKQNPVMKDKKRLFFMQNRYHLSSIAWFIKNQAVLTRSSIFFVNILDDKVIILEKENNDPPMKSVVLFGFGV